jgi:ribosomal peptide maturation radical SAM protein 1
MAGRIQQNAGAWSRLARTTAPADRFFASVRACGGSTSADALACDRARADDEVRMNAEPVQPGAAKGGPRRILLVCPPFQHLHYSPLCIARLATFVRTKGVHCAEAYLHFDLARLIGAERYQAAVDAGLSSELLFAEGLHGPVGDPAAQKKLDDLFGPAAERAAILRDLSARALSRIQRETPDIVGLTTSANQLMAALWLGRAIKKSAPAITIVLGGSACTEPMGDRILEGYPDVDFAVSGDGDYPLLSLGQGEDPPERLIRSRQPTDIESLPIPDYETYIREAEDLDKSIKLQLAFESSRGCWWGRKNQCKFCGLNGDRMAFQAKSSARVLSEIRTLWQRHGRNLFATDTIMAMEHLRHVMPELARDESRPNLFYEVKSNMTEADVVALKRANVLAIQPGIESLSTRLLGLLNKGVTAIQNLALLKWCRERGIAVGWNQLFAIPGEQSLDYFAQIALMAKIPHFAPPERPNAIRIDRFSPYFDDYRSHGWSAIEPLPEYRALHPHLDDAARRDIAYHFNGTGGVSTEEYFDAFETSIRDWQRRCRLNRGLFLDPKRGLVRNGEEKGLQYPMSADLERVLECTHEVAPISRVLAHAGRDRAFLAELLRHGIIYIEDDKVLNLAVRTEPPDIAC